MLKVTAPAKLNLTLEVLGKRDDGYHELKSVIQTISLCDTLYFEPSRTVQFESKSPEWDAEQSLLPRAVRLLQEFTGQTAGVKISVDKKIPLISGLAGDSSDAAAVLSGLNWLWEPDLSPNELLNLAAKLGSDVLYFLYGGTALIEGRGEKVTPLPPVSRIHAVLLIPPVPRTPGKTKHAYAGLGPEHYTDGQITERLAEMIKRGKTPDAAVLHNAFDHQAFGNTAELAVYREEMFKAGSDYVHLAGSGPTLFSIFHNEMDARETYDKLIKKFECYLVRNWS